LPAIESIVLFRKRGCCLFFVLSKTLGAMVMPTNLLIEIGLIGAMLLLTRFARLGRRLLVASVVLLAICGLTPLGKLLLYPLDSRFPPWDPARGAPDGIIILGGPIDPDVSDAHHTAVTRNGTDRLIAGAALAYRYPNAKIVFSGGSANLISHENKEADYAEEILVSLGVPKSRLIMERQSRNTYENAVFSKAQVSPKQGERWLLVTSAYHMPRSIGLFRKAGFAVEPYPVDWRVGDLTDLVSFNNFALDGLIRTDTAVREWIGLLAYRLVGRTDALFPGPNAP
jgi:uncharacterized SAM-binding protein YcdF (DUF218 family)